MGSNQGVVETNQTELAEMSAKRKSSWRKWFGAVLVILFVAAAVFFYLLESSPRFHSSPTESRETESYLANTHYIDRTPLPSFENHRFELIGVAVWVPGPDDQIPIEMQIRDWTYPVKFRAPETGAFCSESELKSQGVPAGWFHLDPHTDRPLLRLLIRSRDGAPINHKLRHTAAFDVRTGAAAANAFPRDENFARFADQWAILDFELRIWHDTAIEIAVPAADLTEFQRFSIEELPEMPNSRQIENLFEVRMPRVSVQAEIQGSTISYSEGRLLNAIGHATESAVKVEALLWFELDGIKPAALPPDFSFRDTSPQQLLDWYLENTAGSSVRYDAEQKLLIFNEQKPDTWWKRTKSWWREHKPDWL
ncbi:MAG: hypothetical protein ACI8UO_003348 [Verrucomicrobiales bacterium]|jgi:hypothetical protein